LQRRRLRGLAAVCFAAAGTLGVLPTTSAADEPMVVGWWYRDIPLSDADPNGAAVHGRSAGAPVLAALTGSPTGPAQVPPLPVPTVPPDVTVPDPGGNVPTPTPTPEGGLLVANDSTGVRGISAMRFDAPGAGGAIVSLRIAPGSTPSSGINACPALSDWLPGPDQEWSARPAHDCERMSVSSTLSADGLTMTWALPDTFQRPDAATYDVLLVPAGGDGTPYQISFEKPDADALTVTSPYPADEPPPEDPVPEGLPPSPAAFSPDGFDLGGLDELGPEVVPGVPTEHVGSSREPAGALGRLDEALQSPTTRRLATALLIALGAYAYWQSNQADRRAPRLLGALAGPSTVVADAVLPLALTRERGIGRFARHRTARPPRL
jgi:hypothetical protein